MKGGRADGTIAKLTFTKKGWFPHDAIHLVVESELKYETGFWGRVFEGTNPEEVNALAKAGGHASSSRAESPKEEIVELLQAERIVECFEVELWGEPADIDTFRSVLDAACSQSKIRSPNVTDENINNIRAELHRLLNQWLQLSIGESIVVPWP